MNNWDSENLIVVKIDHTIDANNSIWYRFQQDTGLQAVYTDPINLPQGEVLGGSLTLRRIPGPTPRWLPCRGRGRSAKESRNDAFAMGWLLWKATHDVSSGRSTVLFTAMAGRHRPYVQCDHGGAGHLGSKCQPAAYSRQSLLYGRRSHLGPHILHRCQCNHPADYRLAIELFWTQTIVVDDRDRVYAVQRSLWPGAQPALPDFFPSGSRHPMPPASTA
jgi:hypothetical protein